MSTNFSDDVPEETEWLSQSEAARVQGVSRQAIHKLVRSGRIRSMRLGGHVLVHRQDVEKFRPKSPGRPPRDEVMVRTIARVKALIDTCDVQSKQEILDYLRSHLPSRAIEERLGAPADVILDALDRAGELTLRMFRGVIAEAAFAMNIIPRLQGWQAEGPAGNLPYDFLLVDSTGPVRVQVKLQRSEKHQPIRSRSGHFLVETQKTRAGAARAGGGPTRPYGYSEFDVLAVCMQPSTGRWDHFLYTVTAWLQPSRSDPARLATFQPVPAVVNEDWTDSFETCVTWSRENRPKRIGGSTVRGKGW